MGFVKVVKNKAYYKRFQVKFKRRRECKTDYYARKRLIIQDKNKYKTPKYRFVVRITNKDIICQIFSADLVGDVCVASAYSHELKRYGVKLGLTNFAAAYCTGLLLARRVNAKFNLEFEGNDEPDGDYYEVEGPDEGKQPFCAYMDVGLQRTTTGARIFGALKGACDGGLDIAHNAKRFPRSRDDDEPNPEVCRKYIFGGHVAEYMEMQQEDDPAAYAKQFKRYNDAGIGPDDIEGLYEAAHKAIRAEPNKPRGKDELGRFCERKEPRKAEYTKKRYNRVKLSVQQRKDRIRQKLTSRGYVSLAANPRGTPARLCLAVTQARAEAEAAAQDGGEENDEEDEEEDEE